MSRYVSLGRAHPGAALSLTWSLAVDMAQPLLTAVVVLVAVCAVPAERLVWHDEFDTLNHSVWNHLVTAWRGGNQEFEYYRNSRNNR